MNYKLIQPLLAFLSAASLLTAVGCMGTPPTPHLNDARRQETPCSAQARMEAAERLCKVGRYYEASFQLEAALDLGGKEVLLLPRLAAAQIRAKRLRAAKRTLVRLMTVAPNHPQAEALLDLLEAMAPSPVAIRREGTS